MVWDVISAFYNRGEQVVQKIYRNLNQQTHGVIGIIVRSISTFADCRVSQAAASLGYYTLFSIFPLLLVIITIASYIVDKSQVQALIMDWVTEFIPFASGFITENITFIFNNSNIAGIVALISLLWSATTVFYNLVYNINLPWSMSSARAPIKNRLAALAIIAGLLGLLVISITLNTIVDLLNRIDVIIGFSQIPVWNWFLNNAPSFLRLTVMFSLYKWIPNHKVRSIASLIGATLAMFSLEVTTFGFSWMLQNGFVRYQVVYGTLGSIMTLMLWIYLNCIVLLYCAHLTAAIDIHQKNRTRGRRNLKIPAYRYILHRQIKKYD